MKMKSTLLFLIAIFNTLDSCYAQYDESGKNSHEPTSLEKREMKQIQAEQNLRDVIGTLGPNQHYKIPADFKDFGRRFVLQYPYTEKKLLSNVIDEESLDDIIKDFLKNNDDADKSVIPLKAPPELVLSVAKQSALLAAKKYATDYNDVSIEKKILRSGDYWNDVAIEKGDPKRILRSKAKPNIKSIQMKFMPGSDLYDLVNQLKKISPRLLYVINDDSQ